MLLEVRVGLKVCCSVRKIPVLVVPSMAFSNLSYFPVVPYVILCSARFVSVECIAMDSSILKDFVGNSPTDDIKPPFAISE